MYSVSHGRNILWTIKNLQGFQHLGGFRISAQLNVVKLYKQRNGNLYTKFGKGFFNNSERSYQLFFIDYQWRGETDNVLVCWFGQ